MTAEQSVFFREFYIKHFQYLVVYAYRFLGDWHDAEVAAQEAFLTGIMKIDAFSGSEAPLGWIKKTVWNIAANMNRAKRIREKRTVPMENADIQPAVSDLYEGVDSVPAHCKELLSPKEYALFYAAVVAGAPISEVCRNFGLSYEACRKRVSRILKKLQKNWDA